MADIAQLTINNTDYDLADDTKVPYDLLKDTVGWTGKNLLHIENPLTREVFNGISTTLNSDGSMTINGTATSTHISIWDICKGILLNTKPLNEKQIPNGKYLLTLVNSSGTAIPVSRAIVQYAYVTADNKTYNDATVEGRTDGVVFEVTSEHKYNYLRLFINNGATFNNETVYPMLRKANIMDGTYEPYNPSVKQVLRDNKIIEGKNLIDVYLPSMNGQSDTLAGVTYTINASDNSYILNGTVENNAGAFIPPKPSWDDRERYAPLPKGTYRIVCTNDKNISFSCQAYHKVSKTSEYVQDAVSNDGQFTFTDNYAVTWVRVSIPNGTVLNNVNFKFMVCKATETDPAYEQYYAPGVVTQEAQNILGAKNLLPYPYKNASLTHRGITFTVNSDYSITANGTASGGTALFEVCWWEDSNGLPIFPFDDDDYILSGCPFGGSSSSYGVDIFEQDNYGNSVLIDSGNGVIIPRGHFKNRTKRIQLRVFVNNNITVSNVVFKPMVRYAGVKDNTYAPYAMTNRGLTKALVDYGIPNSISLRTGDDLNDIKTPGFYSILTIPSNSPENVDYAAMVVMLRSDGGVTQVIIKKGVIYNRTFGGNPSSWTSWYKFTGTIVS